MLSYLHSFWPTNDDYRRRSSASLVCTVQCKVVLPDAGVFVSQTVPWLSRRTEHVHENGLQYFFRQACRARPGRAACQPSAFFKPIVWYQDPEQVYHWLKVPRQGHCFWVESCPSPPLRKPAATRHISCPVFAATDGWLFICVNGLHKNHRSLCQTKPSKMLKSLV